MFCLYYNMFVSRKKKERKMRHKKAKNAISF